MFEIVNDEALLIDCKKAVQVEKKSTARVLEYLSEIDRRRLWLKEGFSSLHDFCIRFLNYSESEANRRIQACRLSSKIEEIKALLEEAKLLASEKDHGYQCAYTSQKGIRCNQWANLQIDHKRSWGLGGSSHDKANLRPLCRAHNLYMAKINFGKKVPALHLEIASSSCGRALHPKGLALTLF